MTAPKRLEYEPETKELQPFEVIVGGENVTEDVVAAVVLDGLRPTVWVEPVLIDGVLHVWVEGLTFGAYRVFAKVTSNPEIPVLNCGTFYING